MIPYTKFVHMLAIPTNQLLSKLAAKGSLQRVDIEALLTAEDAPEEFTIGVADGGHLTRKQRLDLVACIECGRCDAVCPARTADQPLSPRRLVSDLKTMLAGAEAARGGSGGKDGAAGAEKKTAIPIAGAEGTVFADEQFIWHCRTCHGCQSICPAGIAHVDLFVELAAGPGDDGGQVAGRGGQGPQTMEAQGNPFGSQAERLDLVKKLEIPILAEGEETEILLWIGCVTTFDPQKHALIADLVALLRQAGVRFAHLGRDETCCGDPARLLGDENLFQTTAKQTIAGAPGPPLPAAAGDVPARLQRLQERVPAVRRRLPGRAPHRAAGRVAARRPLKPAVAVPAKVAFHDPATWVATRASSARRARCCARSPGWSCAR